jgi:hypothetical protein
MQRKRKSSLQQSKLPQARGKHLKLITKRLQQRKKYSPKVQQELVRVQRSRKILLLINKPIRKSQMLIRMEHRLLEKIQKPLKRATDLLREKKIKRLLKMLRKRTVAKIQSSLR